MKGRPADWQAQLAAKPLGLAVPAAAAAGFQGIYVDPRGYHGRVPAQVMATLRALLGVPPLLSPNRDLWFFDMRPYIRRLQASHTAAQLQALRDATLRPLRVTCATDRLDVDNPYPDTRTALLTAFVTPGTPTPADLLAAGAPSPTRVLVSYPDGSTARLSVTAAPIRIEKLLALSPGHSVVRFGVPRGTPQTGPQVAQATLTEGAFAPFADATSRLASGGPASGLVAPPCALGAGT